MKLREIFLTESLANDLESQHRLYYHVSPLPKFTANRQETLDALYDVYGELEDKLESDDISTDEYYDIQKKLKNLNKLEKAIKSGNRAFGDNALIDKDSFYASSQPEYWMSVQEDELGLDYSHGGIFAVVLKQPAQENFVRAGMGHQAPEVEIRMDNVENIVGPFKSKAQAWRAVNSQPK